jgi:hypothetical protein
VQAVTSHESSVLGLGLEDDQMNIEDYGFAFGISGYAIHSPAIFHSDGVPDIPVSDLLKYDMWVLYNGDHVVGAAATSHSNSEVTVFTHFTVSGTDLTFVCPENSCVSDILFGEWQKWASREIRDLPYTATDLRRFMCK